MTTEGHGGNFFCLRRKPLAKAEGFFVCGGMGVREGGRLYLFEVVDGDDEDDGTADLFFDGSGDVHLAGLHDGGEGRDVLDAAGAAFAEDGEDVFDLLVLDAAEDGRVADAKEAAAGAGNGGGVAATTEAVEEVGAVFFVDDGDD